MNNTSNEFNEQLQLDVLVNNLTEVTQDYVMKFDRENLTEVIIPEGVTIIRNWAFDACFGLTSITIGKGVKNIGGDAFCGCRGLTTVTIPNSVTSIGEWAFYNCKGLKNITFEGKTMNRVRSMPGYPRGISLENTGVQVA